MHVCSFKKHSAFCVSAKTPVQMWRQLQVLKEANPQVEFVAYMLTAALIVDRRAAGGPHGPRNR